MAITDAWHCYHMCYHSGMSEKVVVDTSVIIGALIGKRGANREVLRQCLAGEYLPLISNSLFQEYEDASFRPRIRRACPLDDGEIRDFLNAFYSVCHWVPIYYLPPRSRGPRRPPHRSLDISSCRCGSNTTCERCSSAIGRAACFERRRTKEPTRRSTRSGKPATGV